MAGIFKNLDASDIRLTPFRSHKKWNGTVCYDNYYSYNSINPSSIGTLATASDAVYATSIDDQYIYRLDPSDNFTILQDTAISGLSGSSYGSDAVQSVLFTWDISSGFGRLTAWKYDLVSQPLTATTNQTQVTSIKDVSSYNPGYGTGVANFIYACGDNGAFRKPYSTAVGFSPVNVYLNGAADPNSTGSLVAINAEGVNANSRVLILGTSGSLGVYAITATSALAIQGSGSVSPGSSYGYGVYGGSVYGDTTPAIVKRFLYCNTQDLYFALFEDGYLFKVDSNASSSILASGVADIVLDKSNYISGSATYQSNKVHVVYSTGEIGLDLIADPSPSYEKMVDCRQYVARKPIVNVSINQNQSPALIGIFSGTTSSLQESIFFTVNPDTYEISAPRHMGSTKGDLKIEGKNLDYFLGYGSVYSNRFIQFPTQEYSFQQYKADYNPTPSHPSYNPLNTLFDQGSPTFDRYEPVTREGKFQRVTHKSLNHLFYESFYNNTKAVFGNGNINNQVRLLEDQAYVIDLPQSKYGEAIQQGSVIISANYNISGSNNSSLTIVDDLFGNLYVSGGLVSPVDATYLVSGSMSLSPAGEWPTKDLYKYNGKGVQSFTSSFNQGNWEMLTRYDNITFTQITGSELPVPSPIDLLGVVPTFDSSVSSSIRISPSVVENYRQSYNFENGDFAISFMVRPTDVSSHPSGSIILAKQGVSEDYGTDINGNPFTYASNDKTPYRIRMNSSYEILFERDDLFSIAVASGSLTQNTLHHVVAMKSGSNLYMYVDNVLTQTSADLQSSKACSNKGDIFIGNLQTLERGFDGMIDNIKIYPDSLTDADRSLLYHTLGRGTTIVGNAFYNHGMLVLGSITSRFMDIKEATARGTHTIWEKEVSCTVSAGEFNRSTNPTLQEYNPRTNQYEFRSFTTGSDFKPYVTSVGLYDDYGRLVAVAKLGFPMKLPDNVDTTFIVRYDR